MKHVEAQTQKIRAIPAHKQSKKAWQTLTGGLVVIAGFALPKVVPEFPLWFAMGVVGFGFFIASKEYVTNYLGFIPAAIRDILSALKGNGNK